MLVKNIDMMSTRITRFEVLEGLKGPLMHQNNSYCTLIVICNVWEKNFKCMNLLYAPFHEQEIHQLLQSICFGRGNSHKYTCLLHKAITHVYTNVRYLN